MIDEIDIRQQYMMREINTSSHWVNPQELHQHIGILLREIDQLRDASRRSARCPIWDAGGLANRLMSMFIWIVLLGLWGWWVMS